MNSNLVKLNLTRDLFSEESQLPPDLYHYTKIENVSAIFKKQVLSLKLSDITRFDDETEGKCFLEFYAAALKNLYDGNIITATGRRILEGVQPDMVRFILHGDRKNDILISCCEVDTFVGCFTINGDSSRMCIYRPDSAHCTAV